MWCIARSESRATTTFRTRSEETAINRFVDRRGPRDLGPRINERIRIPEIRLIDEEGKQLGIVPTREALAMAREKGLDLIEIAPTAQPPVCKIIDYGKHKYEEAKRKREAQKKSKTVEIKGVRMRPMTDEHDFQVKLRDTQRFLQEGDKVLVTVIFKSREASHPEFGRAQLQKLAEATANIAVVERYPSMEGRRMTMLLSPKPASGASASSSAAAG
jgi:translation initiation factor IF-3